MSKQTTKKEQTILFKVDKYRMPLFPKYDPDIAIQYCTKAIKINPNDAAHFFYRGVAYYNKKYFDKAIQDFTQVIKIDPNCAGAFWNRAISYYEKGELDKTIQDYNQVRKIDTELAKRFYVKGIAFDKDEISIYTWRGFAFNSEKAFNEAIQCCNEAIRVNPNNASAMNKLGLSYKFKDKEKAIFWLNEALKRKEFLLDDIVEGIREVLKALE